MVVLDNLSAHRGHAVFEAIEHTGTRVLPLLPYSPDCTPIEELFSKCEVFLRRVAARVQGDLYAAIADAPRAATDEDIIGWFRDVGLYVNNL